MTFEWNATRDGTPLQLRAIVSTKRDNCFDLFVDNYYYLNKLMNENARQLVRRRVKEPCRGSFFTRPLYAHLPRSLSKQFIAQ